MFGNMGQNTSSSSALNSTCGNEDNSAIIKTLIEISKDTENIQHKLRMVGMVKGYVSGLNKIHHDVNQKVLSL